MNTSRVRAALAAVILAVCGTAVHAAWPERAISLVVPFAPGGSAGTLAQMLAEKLRVELGQPVIVDNRPGAGSNIGAAFVAKAPPDGYTLLLATSTLAANVALYKTLPFDLQKDLAPVSLVTLTPNVLMVNNALPVKTLREFVDYAKQKKVPISYGSAGVGTSQHLSGALFNSMAQGDTVHVAYKGGAPANTDLIGGQVQAVFSPLVEVLPFIESGRLRPLGVTTKERSANMPNVPAIGEVLPGFEVTLWNGIFAPAKTPPEVIARLNAAIRAVLADPSVKKVLADQGSRPVGSSPQEFERMLPGEIEKWGQLVRLSGARAD